MSTERTREVLLSMMRENHGGGWPGATPMGVVNQKRDLEAEPAAAIVQYGGGDWGVRVSTFHWLAHFLDYDERIDAIYQRWENQHAKRWGQHAMRDFFDWYSARRKDLVLDFDGVHYTYNWENNLSQDFQYAYVTVDNDTWVLLQTHNGVDAREGLANIRVFKLKPHSRDEFLGYNDVEVGCKNGHYWHTEGGTNFYAGGGGSKEIRQLPGRALRESDGAKRHLGELWMDNDEIIYCPICRARNPLHAVCAIG